jgi:cyanophycinase
LAIPQPLEIEPRAVHQPGSPLLLIGGAEDKENEKSILKTFHALAGGPLARVLILPAASSMPEILAEVYRSLFSRLGVSSVQVLQIANRLDADQPWVVDAVLTSTGIFMTGGDQMRLAQLIADTAVAEAMRQSSARGALVLAGTSAGASALGTCMIARGYSGETPSRNIVELSDGLGILEGVIVDQHFHNRNRLARLMTAIATRPDCIGIGIDENTAAVLQPDGALEVIGDGAVTIVDGSELVYNTINDSQAHQPFSVGSFRIHVMARGLRYQIRERKILP